MAGEATERKMVPQTPFETVLYRDRIMADLERHWGYVDWTLAQDMDSDGTWTLHITQRQERFDLNTLLDQPSWTARIWLWDASPDSRPVRVAWELTDNTDGLSAWQRSGDGATPFLPPVAGSAETAESFSDSAETHRRIRERWQDAKERTGFYPL